MVKIITNENIKQLENQQYITKRMDTHELNREAKPIVIKKPRLRIPRQNITRTPAPVQLPVPVPVPRENFNEYKESIDRILINSISMLDYTNASNFKDRLLQSKDINTILKNSITQHLDFSSYPCVLCATVMTAWLESRF